MINSEGLNQQKLFSVIVPIYNVDKWLDKCLLSIKNQTYKDFECLLINDGSTDSSLDICKTYAETDNRFKVFTKKNGGLVSARNFGLKHSCGKYIVYVDGDDWIKRDHLQSNATILKVHPDLDMIIFNYEMVFKDKTVSDNIKFRIDCDVDIKFGYSSQKDKENILFPYILKFNNLILTSWRNVYKRVFLQKHYCKDESIVRAEDFCYTYECVFFAKSIYILDKVLYCYNQLNENSIMHKYTYNLLTMGQHLLYQFNQVFGIDDTYDNILVDYFIDQFKKMIFEILDDINIIQTYGYKIYQKNISSNLRYFSDWLCCQHNYKLDKIAKMILNSNLTLDHQKKALIHQIYNNKLFNIFRKYLPISKVCKLKACIVKMLMYFIHSRPFCYFNN